ncbi:MAG: DoxX family protein [Thermoproteota archaeon]|nr:DoxX family protein [Thermoproteota archaeon]
MKDLKSIPDINMDKLSSFAPLPIRIMMGIAFIIHGLPKFADIEGFQGYFASAGIPPELALPLALLEVIGGIALIVGIATRIASILFMVEMIGAIIMVKASTGFAVGGGYELDLLLMSIAISLLISGPGRISIEKDVLKREMFPKIRHNQKKKLAIG